MSESSLPIRPSNDGSTRFSIDGNGDSHLEKVWDASAANLEEQRDKLNKEVTATKLHERAQPSQLFMAL